MEPSCEAICWTLEWMLSRASSPVVSPRSLVAARNDFFARSVFFRGSVTLKSSAGTPLDSGPADRSRSSWSAWASEVACFVIFVSSCMCSSCWMSFMESLIRRPPSVVAATTGRASRETRRVLMRQLRRATRDPVLTGPRGLSAETGSDPAPAAPPERWARSLVSPAAAGPGFWACWGEEPRSVPPRGSCSAAALPSLLKRPCTSVATSGPGVLPS